MLLYHPQSEMARILEEFAHDFAHRRGHDIDLLSLETRDGAATASLYDIVRYPALFVTNDDGQLLRLWEGDNLPPLMDEVAGYLVA